MRLRKLLILLVMIATASVAQAQMRVTGVVLDPTNEPLIGATIAEKGKPGNGTSTDFDGKFTLTVPSSKSKIVVTSIGYKQKEVSVKSGEMVIVLEEDSEVLSEVVVTGMAKVDKRLFTGATQKVDASKAKLDGVADVSRALEGRAAGVSVQNVTGTFGTAPKIRVRGATSIYGNSRPLWVVDGVVLEDNVEISADDLSSGDAVTLISSAIAGLNADDIESFQILKDGSATSIYGAKAMAGVIVVTTKSGRSGHTSINYTGEFTYRMKPSYSNFNISNSQDQMGIYKEMENKGWLEFASLINSSNTGIYGHMYNLLNQYENGQFGLANTAAARNAYLREAEFRNTDWFDLLFNNNVMQNHSVAISGGNEKGNFYTSVSLMNDPGWYKASSVERYTFNANASYNLTDKIRVKILTSDSYRKQKAPGTLSQSVDPVNMEVNRSFDINPYSYALNTSRTLDPNTFYKRNYTSFNIFNELENNYIDIDVMDLKFQGELNIRPVEGLEINLLGSFRHSSSEQNHLVKEGSNQAMAYRAGVDPEDAIVRSANRYLYTDPDVTNGLPETILPEGGMWFQTINSVSQYDFRGTVQYQKTFKRDHTIYALGGMEANKVDRHAESFDAWGIIYGKGNLPFTSYKAFKQQEEENTNYFSNQWTYSRDLAYFGQLSYSYAGRYIWNGTIHYAGSNKMGKSRQSRWLPTWNMSAAWNLHEEPFFKRWKGSHKAFTNAKIRLSYSLVGIAGPSSVSNAQAIVQPVKPWRMETDTKETGLELVSLANSELTYEKKHEFDIGADLGFLNNRINLVFDWYKRNNYDLIGHVYTQGVGGVTQKYANVAEMASHGVEFTLSTTNIKTRDFSWTSDLTFAYAKNKITKLVTRSRVADLVPGTGYAREGYPVRAIFSIPFVGLNEYGLPVVLDPDGNETTGSSFFQERDKLDFLKYEGPADPLYTGGLNNTFTWKGLRLNVFLTYSFGNKIRLDPVFSASYSDLTAHPKEFKNRWVVPGDEKYTDIPVILPYRQYYDDRDIRYGYSSYNYSTARIASGDFIRLKEISLMYELPEKFISKLRLSSASVKLAATNVGLLYSDSKLNGQDPEFFNSGGVASPNPRQFTFTLRFGL